MFKGRLNRAFFWCLLALYLAIYYFIRSFGEKLEAGEFLIAILCIPRLHDIGRTGWYFLIPVTIELLAVIAMFIFNETILSLNIAGLAFMIFIVVLGLIPGQPVSNRFGDQPKPWLGSWRR